MVDRDFIAFPVWQLHGHLCFSFFSFNGRLVLKRGEHRTPMNSWRICLIKLFFYKGQNFLSHCINLRIYKAECLIKHVEFKVVSRTRSLDNLTMEKPAQGISDGMYTYKHRCEGGVDIHDIEVKKSAFRILLYYIGTICLLVTVCRTLLSKVFFFL